MKECLTTNRFPEFYDIIIPSTISTSFFLEPIYTILKSMGDGKEKHLSSHWKILSSRYAGRDLFLNKFTWDLIKTECASNIDVYHSIYGADWDTYIYSLFKFSKFNVSHIDFEIYYDDCLQFFNRMKLNNKLQEEFRYIKSIRIVLFYHNTLTYLDRFIKNILLIKVKQRLVWGMILKYE